MDGTPRTKISSTFLRRLRQTRNKDREEDAMVIYITISGKSTIIKLNENTPTYDVKFAALPVSEINLNFGTGAAGSMI